MPSAVAEPRAVGVTLGRLVEIERGQGPPPTEAELSAKDELETRLRRSPGWQRMAKTVETIRKINAAANIEKTIATMRKITASIAQEERRRTPAICTGRAPRRNVRTVRRRATVATRAGADDGSGSSEDDPPSDLERPPSGAAASRTRAHVGRRLAAARAA
jgi:hypothetical protein